MAAKQPQDHKTPKNQPKTVEAMGRHPRRQPRDLRRPRHGRIPLRPPNRPVRQRCRRVRHRPLPQEALRPQYTAMKTHCATRHRAREHRQGQRIHRPAPRTARPKLLTLIGMLATAPDALEADFQRFYGLTPTSYGLADCPPTGRPHWPPTSPASPSSGKNSTAPRMGRPNLPPRRHPRQPRVPRLDENQGSLTQGARWRGQLQRPGTVRHEATGGEVMAMDDEQLAAYLAAPRTTIREA